MKTVLYSTGFMLLGVALGVQAAPGEQADAPYQYSDQWSVVSAPPPAGPYRAVNIDPRVPGPAAVAPIPMMPQEQMPADVEAVPSAATDSSSGYRDEAHSAMNGEAAAPSAATVPAEVAPLQMMPAEPGSPLASGGGTDVDAATTSGEGEAPALIPQQELAAPAMPEEGQTASEVAESTAQAPETRAESMPEPAPQTSSTTISAGANESSTPLSNPEQSDAAQAEGGLELPALEAPAAQAPEMPRSRYMQRGPGMNMPMMPPYGYGQQMYRPAPESPYPYAPYNAQGRYPTYRTVPPPGYYQNGPAGENEVPPPPMYDGRYPSGRSW